MRRGTEVGREPGQPRAIGALADDEQRGVAHALLHERHRADQVLDPFARLQPADVQDDAPVRRHGPRPWPWDAKRIRVDSVRHNLVLGGEVRGNGTSRGVGHRDSRAQPARKRPKRPPPRRVEPMTSFPMHVERSDQRRVRAHEHHPGHERRQRFVDVDDVERPLQEAADGSQRARVHAEPRFSSTERHRDGAAERQLALLKGSGRRPGDLDDVSEASQGPGLCTDLVVDPAISRQIVGRDDRDPQRAIRRP